MLEFVRTQLAWVVFAVIVVIAAVFAGLYRARLLNYVQEVRQEWTRVTTPSREESVAHTAVVIVGVIIAAAFMFVVDLALGPLMGLFYRH
jgi:preprotein translocase SecE subunit